MVNEVEDKTSCSINKQKEKSNTSDLTISRAYFRKIKHPGIDAFFFWKKNFLLIWIDWFDVKNIFQLGEIRPPPTLLDNRSALLSNKAGLLLKQKTLFQEQFDSILHFK